MTLVKILEAPSSDPGKTPRIYTIFLKYLQKNLRSVQRSVSHIEDTYTESTQYDESDRHVLTCCSREEYGAM